MLLSVGIAKLVLFHDMVLTCVDQLSRVLAWSWTLNKSCSLSGVKQNLFLDQDLFQLLCCSNSGLKFESAAVFNPEKYSKSKISGKDSWHVTFSCFR